MAIRVEKLTLRGFKSIRELVDFEPSPINVFVGANGAGKSNLISFFRLLSWMMASPGNLQEHVAASGGANSLLHYGAARTREIEAELQIATEKGRNDYAFRLFYAAGDTLVFAEEKYRFSRSSMTSDAPWKDLGAGHREAKLIKAAEEGNETARVIWSLVRKCAVYQFHNTSMTARMRGKWDADDSRWLKEDGANLAAFLLRLREEERPYFYRIVENLRLLLPFFADYELTRDRAGKTILQWREHGSDVVFSAAQSSDGMLRTMALVALLLQPERDLPGVLILDEPELGLHPSAINVVASLMRAVSRNCQVLAASQSTAFVNQFGPEEIVVVDRLEGASVFHRLDPVQLEEWLAEYSIAELWEKNVFGGKPG
jgi:predicted ATPase